MHWQLSAGTMKTGLGAALAAALLALAACGGGDDEPETTAEVPPCADVETVKVPAAGRHVDGKLTVADFETNPPAGGDHSPTALQTGTFYTKADLGEAVHALEHGAVIGWHNGLAKDEEKTMEKTFNKLYTSGYESLATIELADLDVPFALSAWGALQKCEEFDPSEIEPFVDEHYGSSETSEGMLACFGRAAKLPACKPGKGG